MKKIFAVLALTAMMVAVSAPTVLAANHKAAIAGIDDKEKKEKKKKAKKSCCSKDDQTRATAEGKGDGKSCKGEGKSCCKGKTEAKTESKPQ